MLVLWSCSVKHLDFSLESVLEMVLSVSVFEFKSLEVFASWVVLLDEELAKISSELLA